MLDQYYLPISALQHYAYCPRQFALIHVEQSWVENLFTAEGKELHKKVDAGETETRKGFRYERSVDLVSHTLFIVGKSDLIEIHRGSPPIYFPVEYKRGKAKIEDWDRVQLCAQALCLEEMHSITVEKGAIWYWETRVRDQVDFTAELRGKTMSFIHEAHKLMEEGYTPRPTNQKNRCRNCSLQQICQPNNFLHDHSVTYIEKLFSYEKTI